MPLSRTTFRRFSRFAVAALLALGLAGQAGCGSSACSEMMGKVCDDCQADLAPEWRAACICWDDDLRARALGFRCRDPDALDQDGCRITLEQWGKDSCSLLSRDLPEEERLKL